MTVHIAGLGPGDANRLTIAVRELLGSGLPVIVRTRHHPCVAELDPGATWDDCDDLYERQDFEAAYGAMADRVLARAREGDVVYAVPGHPLAGEASVQRLLERCRAEGIETRVHAGLSFVDAAIEALQVDVTGLQVCDALALRVDPQRPALIAQVYDRDRASELKLELLALYPPDHQVTLLAAAGTDEAEARTMPLAEIDHRAPGHLHSLYVPPIDPVDDVRRFDGLAHIVERLNAPGGCPWDREQTHESLRHYLLEESYEVLETIDDGDMDALPEELGDVLLQVLMHAEVARRTGDFSFGDITEQISRKLVRRHPHVFGDATAETADDVRKSWEELKQAEKPEGSILDGVPAALPALAASQSLQGRARRIGFEWPDIEGPLDKLREEIAEFAHADGDRDREDEFGDILFVLCNIADRLGVEAEQALRRANTKFRRRFRRVEELSRERGIDLADLDLAGLDALWDEAKSGATH